MGVSIQQHYHRLPILLTLCLILYFWLSGLAGLDRFPKIHEDEAWQAAPGYTFWAEGRFGSDLFAGFFGMERHYYGFMPLFPLMVGAALHGFGLGLFQARLVPLGLITLTLAVTYRLGRDLFRPWHGALAVAILAGWRIAGPFAHLVSGIPLADVARIGRYDSAVPLFSLLALWLFGATVKRSGPGWKGRELRPPPSARPFLLIGLLIGLATLSHLYGAFWLLALALALLWLWGRRCLTGLVLMGLGFGLALTPWLIFVASGWPDFLRQNQNYADRFSLLDFRFYLINLLLEPERYDPILNGARLSLGAWLWLVGVGLSLAWLIKSSLVRGRQPGVDQTPARIVVVSLASVGGLFALLVTYKTFSYLATLWPLFAIIIAAGFMHLWRQCRPGRGWRVVLVGLWLLAMCEGGLTQWRMQNLAQQTTPYQLYTAKIAAQLPPQTRLMALQHYWLGLAQHSAGYRSILVPVFWSSPKYVEPPRPFAQTANLIPPDVILLDQIMLDFLAKTADPAAELHPLQQQIWRYLADRQARLTGVVDDPSYGRLEIYRLK